MIGIGLNIGNRVMGGGVAPYVGLLDTYPNAAAAYSVRLLKSDYTGNAIRVRRSSDNTEQNIGFTALGNLDTTALSSFCSGTNGFVTTWYDQSGNGYDAIQTTASNQPEIVSSGSVLTLNGKPSIYFNNPVGSSSQWLNTGTNLSLFNVGSIYSVNSYLNNTAFHAIFSNGYNAPAGIWVGRNSSATTLQIWCQGQNFSSSTPAIVYGVQLLQSYFFKSAVTNGVKIYANNSLNAQSSLTFGAYLPLSQGAIGRDQTNADFPLYGYMNEIVFYAENTDVNNSGINTEINTYYGTY
jgi:hypothetical protein